MTKTANTVVALLCTVPLLVSCVASETSSVAPTPQQQTESETYTTYPASEAGSFDEIGNRVATHPDVQVPESSSLREACEIYFAADETDSAIDERDKPARDELLDEYRLGLLTEEEWQDRWAPYQREETRGDRLYKAAAVGVLRAAGYSDWKVYSRYDLEGVGDLWRSNIIAGDRVADDENHPDYRYTYRALWTAEVRRICSRYKNLGGAN